MDAVLVRRLVACRLHGTFAAGEIVQIPGPLQPLPARLAAGDRSLTRMHAHLMKFGTQVRFCAPGAIYATKRVRPRSVPLEMVS